MLKQFIKRKLTAYLQDVIMPDATEATTARVVLAQLRERYWESVLHCHEAGIAPSAKDERTPVIVSLTTHGNRLYETCLTIESVMQGTVKPDSIVLWWDEKDNRELPITLQKQVKRGLQVLRTRDIGSYEKLLPALKMFPNANIVTVDDDIFYPHDFLECLLASHSKSPHSIVANTIMKMSYNNEGIPAGIREWPYLNEAPADTPTDLFFEGFGGVFYPAGCLPEEVFNEKVFSNLCPTADDIWFNAMARLAHTPIQICSRSTYDFIAAVNSSCQTNSLSYINNGIDHLNDRQLHAVWRHYHLQGQ